MRFAVFCILLGQPVLAQSVPEPEGYRLDAYRGAVPDTLDGGTVVNVDEAHALWLDGITAFVDVLPQAPKPPKLPEGTIWRDKPRHSIPDAIWLPNVGYGALADPTIAYFKRELTAVTQGDLAHPVVFFCLAECWMSWNAAKRAISWGYGNIYWFPEGTDGWDFDGYPLARVLPQEPKPKVRTQ